MHTRKEQMEAFGRFLDILDELREKCPWDRKQTNESLRPNTIEETYELCDALMKDDKKDICKELGDVLLHRYNDWHFSVLLSLQSQRQSQDHLLR